MTAAVRRRILVVSNPAAGPLRMRRLAGVLDRLKALADVTVVETTRPGHATEIARSADPAGVDVIAAAGGDGTVNEIINGLVDKDIAVGLIPLGTANVLSFEIGLGLKAERVARTLAFGPTRAIRVGRVNGRRFIIMAGIGFDADVVASVSSDLKHRLGPLAYVVKSAVRAFDRLAPDLEVEIDGVKRRAASVVACNGRFYGGPFIAAPAASLADDRLHVVLLKGSGPWAAAKYGLSLILGGLARLKDVEVLPARRLSIAGTPGRAIQADGDIVAHLPAEIVMDPAPVRLVYPG
jgi:YegS/Rv2252/BmrU family lipid kinase